MPHHPPAVDDVVAAVRERFGAAEATVFRGQTRLVVPEPQSFDTLAFLKERGFDLLVDVSCVDYLDYPDAKHRYGLVYLLANTATNQRLTVRVFVDDPEPTVKSVVSLWEAANSDKPAPANVPADSTNTAKPHKLCLFLNRRSPYHK